MGTVITRDRKKYQRKKTDKEAGEERREIGVMEIRGRGSRKRPFVEIRFILFRAD